MILAEETPPVETPPVPAPTWFDAADAETKGYITNRGLDKLKPEEAALNAIKAHREAMVKLGAPADQLIRMPKDAGDQEAWDKLYGAIGKPKDAAGYDFSAAKNLDEDAQTFLRELAFKSNVSKSAAEALALALSERSAKTLTDSGAEAAAKAALELTELKKNWGFGFEANKLVAQRAVEALGVTPEAVAAFEGKVGYKAVMEMFHKIGTKIGEDKFITSQVTGAVMSVDGAKERITSLKNDAEFRTKLLAGGIAQQKEWNDLHRIAFGQGAA